MDQIASGERGGDLRVAVSVHLHDLAILATVQGVELEGLVVVGRSWRLGGAGPPLFSLPPVSCLAVPVLPAAEGVRQRRLPMERPPSHFITIPLFYFNPIISSVVFRTGINLIFCKISNLNSYYL